MYQNLQYSKESILEFRFQKSLGSGCFGQVDKIKIQSCHKYHALKRISTTPSTEQHTLREAIIHRYVHF